MSEFALSESEYREWQRIKRKREYRNQLYQRQKEAREIAELEEASNPTIVPSPPTIVPATEPESKKPTVEHVVIEPEPLRSKVHYVKSYHQNCPECGEPNPEFKDETECSSCHKPLGGLETAQNLPGCPYCGGMKLTIKESVQGKANINA